jgi:hypothetical protein
MCSIIFNINQINCISINLIQNKYFLNGHIFKQFFPTYIKEDTLLKSIAPFSIKFIFVF